LLEDKKSVNSKEGRTVAKKTDKEIRQEVEHVMQKMAIFKEDAKRKGLEVNCLSEQEVLKKIQPPTSPTLFAQLPFLY
jgi:hypothetical protein